jgi:hypothetical protein
MKKSRRFAGLSALLLLASFAGLHALPALATHGADVEVTVGSNDEIFSQNKQNEPAVAIDPGHPWLVAAGDNDNIDMEACNAGADNSCPFTTDVGGSGIQFSFNSGDSWMQPTYTGLTARDCLGVVGDADPPCVAHTGPIGTLPHYAELGMVSDGDPGLVFGPAPGADGFSWGNGSRLYYVNLSSPSTVHETAPFKGFEAIAVSRMDVPASLDTAAEAGALVADADSWADPVVVSKQSSTTFSDKEQIWADQNEDSPFFGNAYVCWASFRSLSGGNASPNPTFVATSRDGGETWTSKQVTEATNNPFNAKKGFGRSGCTIRTDSHGVVYLMANQFAVGSPGVGKHILIKSFDGGKSWTRPKVLFDAVDTCFAIQFDGTSFRCVMDGVAGARDDLSASPSLDIASGTGSTDILYEAWVDGRSGSADPVNNHTQLRFAFSINHGTTWTQSVVPIASGDRPYYAALAVSPDGTDLYVVYNAFTNPYRMNTTSARGLVGVILHANVTASGAPGTWTTVHRGTTGDPRGSAQNNIAIEFLGDYVYADATNEYAVAVWNDVREASPCGAVNTWRTAVQAAGPPLDASTRPAIQQVCPTTFGNTDIRAWSGAS